MKKLLIGALIAALSCGGMAWASESGGHGGKPHWGYAGEGAPEHWGEMAPEFAACKDGQSQSPIDISVAEAEDVDLPVIDFSYQATPVKMVNNGHTIQVNYAPGSKITVAGQTYDLKQFHFHTLSENAVDGKLFPLEAHLVHADESGKLAVVGVLFDEGAANSVIEQLWTHMPALPNSDILVSNETVNVMEMLPESKDYYSWSGSLTTPPCTEGVKWMLLQQPMTVSAEQVKKFSELMHGHNNRPVQLLYGRTLQR
ncbi:carbonic anhydrase [Desulfuromonas versatilis]|uniref:Carbonic anhydrase n=1 Tax=Desulfuromonas versatilis TaxID=2802975 RepID=A0ABM8HRL8_9BACT|nr:carbonic anhydrase family protein [Desulfuromonas versatilis]BCR03247.1 carbonic anhydrase [Desulfuromonas versatilis]